MAPPASSTVTLRGLTKCKAKLNDLVSELEDTAQSGLLAIQDESKKFDFTAQFKLLDKTYERFMTAWDKADDEIDHLNSTLKVDEQLHVMDSTIKDRARAAFRRARACNEQLTVTPTPDPNSPLNVDNSMNNSVNSSPFIKLPAVSLRPFTGNLSEWSAWRDLFQATIVDNPQLSDIQRMQYLTQYVTEQAALKIQGIPFTAGSFWLCWSTLRKAFDSNRRLAIHYLDKLLTHKPKQGRPTYDSLLEYQAIIAMSIESFNRLIIPATVERSQYILAELSLRVMDPYSRSEFEEELASSGTEFPSWSMVSSFLERKQKAMSFSNVFEKQKRDEPASKGGNPSKNKPRSPHNWNSAPAPTSLVTTTSSAMCPVCDQGHQLTNCGAFMKGDPSLRLKLLNKFVGCKNCFSHSHKTADCSNKPHCHCGSKHHELLHLGIPQKRQNHQRNSKSKQRNKEQKPDSQSNSPAANTGLQNSTPDTPRSPPGPGEGQSQPKLCGIATDTFEVLLGTVLVRLKDSLGNLHVVRGILDNGSMSTLMTSDLAAKLNLDFLPAHTTVGGLGGSKFPVPSKRVKCHMRSTHSDRFEFVTTAAIVPHIVRDLPYQAMPQDIQDKVGSFVLADPTFHAIGPIQLLIGADLVSTLTTGAPIHVGDGYPYVVPTHLGHVIVGPFGSSADDCPKIITLLTAVEPPTPSIESIMEKFWHVEQCGSEPQSKDSWTTEELACENFFKETVSRIPTGRYVVALPFKTANPVLGPSKHRAVARLEHAERKMEKDDHVRQAYHDFMSEYIALGHMSPNPSCESAYFVPHQPVIKRKDDGSIKIRVTWDGSSKTSKGSLNQYLLSGPKLQNSIMDILMQFRRHPVGLTCDIEKFFRQFLLREQDRRYTHTVWRYDPKDEPTIYSLDVLSYGLTSSPYLSIRALHQLIDDEGNDLPLAARALRHSCYVDDIICSAPNIQEAKDLQHQLIDLVGRGEMQLSKWAASHVELLPASSTGESAAVDFPSDSEVGILGMRWIPHSDSLHYKVSPVKLEFTKRQLLSTIAKIYDPLGLISPVVFAAKTILQKTWLIPELGWDSRLPGQLIAEWSKVCEDLPSLSRVAIPRHIPGLCHSAHIVGFCDASTLGYAASLYVVVPVKDQSCNRVSLIKSKTRLAPIKSCTIPRLELCGALLLAELYSSIKGFTDSLEVLSTSFFTDSTVTWWWLRTESHKLKPFVSNRVVKILSLTKPEDWHWVNTHQNPADLASRGMSASALCDSELWWNGPTWMSSLPPSKWPRAIPEQVKVDQIPEIKVLTISTVNHDPLDILEFCSRFAWYNHLIHSWAFLRRFINNSRTTRSDRAGWKRNLIAGPEFRNAELEVIRVLQQCCLSDLYYQRNLNNLSRELKSLCIFKDDQGILRVGGRLHNADIPPDQKHPILLPKDSHFTNLLIEQLHRRNHHLGPVGLLSTIRQRFWIPCTRGCIRRVIHNCVVCVRYNKQTFSPMMGVLPVSRFKVSKAFDSVAIDMAGPFTCKDADRRNYRKVKIYLCIFICMSVKAIHIESTEDMSTKEFLNAFDRFVARRGVPSQITSDCGSNFQGADKHLVEVYNWLKSDKTQAAILSHVAPLHVHWRFNSPAAPHFSGLVERSVKSTKDLLKKTIGVLLLSPSELNTIVIRIEGILNSRPITDISSSDDDLQCLTPGHFLIGQPLNALPELPYPEDASRLRRWEMLKSRVQYFWTRWKRDYLHHLQQRHRWLRPGVDAAVGDVVILSDDQYVPSSWPLARVVQVHPGPDGHVRVATVKTSKHTYVRPVRKLIPLIRDIDTSTNDEKLGGTD